METHNEHMREAIRLSVESVSEGGGPFGAVVVDSTGAVIGRGKNRVTLHHDPTAHGEIQAIRDAASNTARDDLSGCILYTSAEPCPGCFTESVFNAGIREIYFGNTIADAADIGFADDVNWQVLDSSAQQLMNKMGGKIHNILRDEAQAAFADWQGKDDKTEYYRQV